MIESAPLFDYRPPAFEIQDGDGDDVKILYLSERVGLTPFVEGLLRGLADRFNQQMEIIEIAPKR